MANVWTEAGRLHARYWDDLAADYQAETRISTSDFHYGPLLPGDGELGLLPRDLSGLRCLEAACGAGQNSIVLASRGAEAVAFDISARQLERGRQLAGENRVEVDFRLADMDRLPGDLGTFDLVHSAYGVPFSSDPQSLIRRLAGMLRPGGTLLLSLGHPVYAGEWLDLEGEEGVFLQSYFHPMPDVREGDEDAAAHARAYPISESVGWLRDAGLRLDRLLEPAALPVDRMSTREITNRVPYFSTAWAEQVAELRRFPIVLILCAKKDNNL